MQLQVEVMGRLVTSEPDEKAGGSVSGGKRGPVCHALKKHTHPQTHTLHRQGQEKPGRGVIETPGNERNYYNPDSPAGVRRQIHLHS